MIVALQLKHTEKMMHDILSQMASSEKFLFLGADSWAKNKDVLNVQNKERLLGSLTVTIELPLNQLFGEALRTVSCRWTPSPPYPSSRPSTLNQLFMW